MLVEALLLGVVSFGADGPVDEPLFKASLVGELSLDGLNDTVVNPGH